MFVLFIYSGKLLSSYQKKLPIDELATLLVEACIFADIRGVHSMFNKAIDLLMQRVFCYEDKIPTKPIRLVWENTPEASLLRKLYTAVIIRDGDVIALLDPNRETLTDFPKAAIRDIAVACFIQHRTETLGSEYDFWFYRCKFHMHLKGERCRYDGTMTNEEYDDGASDSSSAEWGSSDTEQ